VTTHTIHAIRTSFNRVESIGHVAGLIFYKRLFELAPNLRPMFPNEIEDQSMKLLDILTSALSMLERPEELRITLEQLGARHVDYGVKREHYDIVGTALLDMLASVLGRDFDPTLREAWTALYGAIATTMLAGAAQVEKGRP
jgi:methyl-accepting chemotaxis protein